MDALYLKRLSFLDRIATIRLGKADSLQARAYAFARQAHNSIGHQRKYTELPYIAHPLSVALIVKRVPHTNTMLAAALLHDTVEDTPVTLNEISLEFGNSVADLVFWLTDVSRPHHGNRSARKAIDREHTALAPPEAKTIKLADLLDNGRDIIRHDRAFASVYLAEKALLLPVLKEGDGTLWMHARNFLEASGLTLART